MKSLKLNGKKKLWVVMLSVLMCVFAALSVGCSKTVTSVTATPLKTEYALNEEFAGGKMTVVFSDGSKQTFDLAADMLTGFDTSVAGEKTVIAKHKDYSASFKITVVGLKYTSLIVKEGSKKEYFMNSDYNAGDITVIAENSDGEKTEVPVTADMLANFSTAENGTRTAKIEKFSLSVDFEYTVRAPKATKVEIVKDETPATYSVGAAFEKVVVLVTYEDGITLKAEITDENSVEYDFSSAGKATVKVKVDGVEISYDVTVIKAVVSMSVDDVICKVDDEFAGAELTVEYGDGTSEKVPVTIDMLEGFSTEKAGVKTVKVNYAGATCEAKLIVANVFEAGVIKIQAEDEEFVDMSGAALQSGATNKFENTTKDSKNNEYSNGAEGYSTCNISVKDNKIVINVYAYSEFKVKLGMRAQSGSNKGLSDQDLSKCLTLALNGSSTTTLSGTVKKASSTSTAWKDMTIWTYLDDVSGELTLKKGENKLVLTFTEATAGTIRLPNIDYFTLTVY